MVLQIQDMHIFLANQQGQAKCGRKGAGLRTTRTPHDQNQVLKGQGNAIEHLDAFFLRAITPTTLSLLAASCLFDSSKSGKVTFIVGLYR
jgi:hypothetical protein